MASDASNSAAERSPLHPLAQLSVLVTARVMSVAEANELTPMQARILGQLRHGPRRMADLARRLDIEKTALTGLVDRAELKGLMVRVAVPGDRRSVNVTATDAGAAAAARFFTQLDASLDELIDTVDGEKREAFRSALGAIISAIAERDGVC